MGQSEYEMIHYETMRHLQCFIVCINFRNAHIHRAWELGLVLEGSARIRMKEDTFQVGPGDLLLFNPNQSHEIVSLTSQPVKILIVQAAVHFCGDYMPTLRRVEFDRVRVSGEVSAPVLAVLSRRMLDTAQSFWSREPYSPLFCVAQVCMLFRDLLLRLPYRTISDSEYSSRKKKADRLDRITGYIEEHYYEQLRLSDLAEAEGVTTAYLSHFLRDNLNITFQDYLNITRFEKALQLIEDPGLSLLDICMECGFSDSRYLNKLFLQRFGCSAREYRAQLAQEDRPVGVERDDHALTSERIMSREEAQAFLEARERGMEKA
ncbi:MAG: AraC family transcriptional regulator [Clostridiales bacterium]|nr:AraC family transcriptional regulator [Clostridiales bacterium]